MKSRTESNKMKPNTATTNPNPNPTTPMNTTSNRTQPAANKQAMTRTRSQPNTQATNPPATTALNNITKRNLARRQATTATTKPPTAPAPNPQRTTRPKPTRAQISLSNKLPCPMHRTASGWYSDIISNGIDGGAFSRRIAADCQSVVYYLDGAEDLPLSLLDECLVESQRQSDESGMPGVLELVTPAGRTLRFPVIPAPLCEVLPPPTSANE